MESGSKRHQQPRDEVGEDHVERRLAAREAPEARPKPAGEPVAPGVGDRRLDGDRIRVDPERCGRPEPEGGDGQDPRAAPDVEDARAGEPAPVRERLRAREAQARRRMQAGPEGHPRIEREDDVAGHVGDGAARSAG